MPPCCLSRQQSLNQSNRSINGSTQTSGSLKPNTVAPATKQNPTRIILLVQHLGQSVLIMAVYDVDAFRSKQFVFVVGDNQAPFTVHTAVIANQSKALDALINGPMAEASEGKAILEDVAEDTFMRFWRECYSPNRV